VEDGVTTGERSASAVAAVTTVVTPAVVRSSAHQSQSSVPRSLTVHCVKMPQYSGVLIFLPQAIKPVDTTESVTHG